MMMWFKDLHPFLGFPFRSYYYFGAVRSERNVHISNGFIPGDSFARKNVLWRGWTQIRIGFYCRATITGLFFFLATNLINIISFFFFLHLDARYGAYFNTHFLFITPRNPSAGLITAIIFKTSTSKSHCRCNDTMSFRNWAICLVRNLISRRIFRKTPCECYYHTYIVMAWS